MATPDINAADFGEVSGVLRSFAARTAIYSPSRDMALVVSKKFHSYPRLGEAPPVSVAPGIDTVDASAIKPDLLGHSYFGDSATVIHDLFWLMKPGFDPEARLLRPAPWERSDIGSFSTSGHPSLEFLQCGGQAVSPAIARLSTGPGAGLKPVPCRHPSISRPTLIASDNATQRRRSSRRPARKRRLPKNAVWNNSPSGPTNRCYAG